MSDQFRAVAWALVALGIVLRLVISWHSIGTNDARFWIEKANEIYASGLFNVYQNDAQLNNPPLPCEWSQVALALSRGLGVSFFFIFRLPAIAADLGSCLLLFKILSERNGEKAGLLGAVAFAWCLDAILVSGYHCYTDSVYSFPALAAAYFIADRRRFFVGGLVLAASINVKLIPVILIPAMFALCRTRLEFRQLFLGLAVGALPFLPPLLWATEGFYNHVICFKSQLDLWGLAVAYAWSGISAGNPFGSDAARLNYLTLGKDAVFAGACLLGLTGRYLRFSNNYVLPALVMAAFLILTPGFGVQYTVAALPLMFAADLLLGMMYGLLAGIFLLVIYIYFWTGTWPAFSMFHQIFPMKCVPWGFAAWLLLILFAIKNLRTGRRAS